MTVPAKILFTNNAETVLLQAIAGSDTTLYLADGSKFPSPNTDEYFLVTLEYNGVREVIRVNSRSGNIFSNCNRGQEDTIPKNFVMGTPVQHKITAGTLDYFRTLSSIETIDAAAAALVSENNAATSEANALAYKNASAASQAAALASQNASAVSQAAALASQNAAAVSETNSGVSEANSLTSETNAAASAASLAAGLASFRELYLGEFATDPTLDGNGAALKEGAEYFNSVSNILRTYHDGAWEDYDATAQAATNNANLSALNAATSEANSLAYKNLTLGYRDAALVSENNSATSEANALSYKNSANTSEVNAGISEVNAAASAASAAASQVNSDWDSTTGKSQILNKPTPENLPLRRPSLLLSFSNSKTVNPMVQFTRGSTGTFINENGKLSIAPVNTPRIEYDPVTGECLGLLIEDSRTNLALYSEDFSNSAWTTNKSAGASVTVNTTVAPDGNTTADTLFLPTASDYLLERISNYPAVSGQSVTYTIFVKSITQIIFFGGSSPTGVDTYSVSTYANGWYRQELTRIFTETTSVKNLDLTLIGTISGSGTYPIWGSQLESGKCKTSYIPTTTVAVTRSRDTAQINGSIFSSIYNPLQGTFYVEAASASETNSISSSMAVSDGTSSNYLTPALSDINVSGVIYSGGSSQIGPTTPGGSYNQDGSFYKAAFAYAPNNCSWACSIGSVLVTNNVVVLPVSVSQLNIGSSYSSVSDLLNGHIKRIAYYPTRLTDTQIQALTTP